MQGPIRYAKSGNVHVAYQVIGAGSQDVVFVPGHISHLELGWDLAFTPIIERLAAFARVIVFDKRGTGLSDRVNDSDLPPLDQRMDDLRYVMDAAGSLTASIVGVSEGGSISLLFAATYPQRTRALVLYGAFARLAHAPDYPFGLAEEEQDLALRFMETTWGSAAGLPVFCPSAAADRAFVERYARFERAAVSPSGATAMLRMDFEIDVRSILPSLRIPTLILHRSGDKAVPVAHGRYLAEQIPGARLIELAGDDHDPVTTEQASEIADEIEEFLTGSRAQSKTNRVLLTLLFTDIVGSTELATTLGDARWRELVERHYSLVRRELGRFGGTEMATLGDGVFATFDGPARAISCAVAIRQALREIGLRIRAGVHTGECERSGDGLAGIAVHVAARIASAADADELLVSSTVKELVAGAGFRFTDRGRQALKGVEDRMRLWRLEDPSQIEATRPR